MYSKTTKVGESNEYQDFLSLHNGRSKRRETGRSHNFPKHKNLFQYYLINVTNL